MLDGYHPPTPSVVQEVLAGLARHQKTLPAKLFYDEEGCRLFGEITRLPEYYLTRTEQALLAEITPHLPAMPGCALVEYGASDEGKATGLLDDVKAASYVPIDIASSALRDMTDRLRRTRPTLCVYPVVADFLQPLDLPAEVRDHPHFGFFPGSTIGNLDPDTAHRFLIQVRQTLGSKARFLVGADLRKGSDTLLPAYDDAQGVTAAFNLNMLTHLNREIGSNFDLAGFAHRAVWNDREGRIEMHLVSLHPQTVSVAGSKVLFADGDTIHTESSYKHTLDGFRNLASEAGWRSEAVWTDKQDLFSIHLLASAE